jgi:hypothetical protein
MGYMLQNLQRNEVVINNNTPPQYSAHQRLTKRIPQNSRFHNTYSVETMENQLDAAWTKHY